MIVSDKPGFVKLIGTLAAIFNREADVPMLEGYWLGLEDLPFSAVEAAIKKAVCASSRMPMPVELRELAGVPRPEQRALEAWAIFERAVVQHGGYKTVTFEDPIINATVQVLGGWERCCAMPAEEFDKWLVKDFMKHYSAMSATGRFPITGPLLGLHDKSNGPAGYGLQEPVLVGSMLDEPRERKAIPLRWPTEAAPPLNIPHAPEAIALADQMKRIPE